ncbi:hypothetical protein Trco_003569 [Trichoderma cornu-damae]|uniref:Uncharacterized protein n=1 Tax=Trichoderma cornu-damae TaxID=654480 RepID=A0A9P8QIY8_9HYPO|nr:hypothetical protein Trco_003569 [Trichoderma cornu-damae]
MGPLIVGPLIMEPLIMEPLIMEPLIMEPLIMGPESGGPVVKRQKLLGLEGAEIPLGLRSGRLAQRPDPVDGQRRHVDARHPEALALAAGDFVSDGPADGGRLEAEPVGQGPEVPVAQGRDPHLVDGLVHRRDLLLEAVDHGHAVADGVDAEAEREPRQERVQHGDVVVKLDQVEGVVVDGQVELREELRGPGPGLGLAVPARGAGHDAPGVGGLVASILGGGGGGGGEDAGGGGLVRLERLVSGQQVGGGGLEVEPGEQGLDVSPPHLARGIAQKPLSAFPDLGGHPVAARVGVGPDPDPGVGDVENRLDDAERRDAPRRVGKVDVCQAGRLALGEISGGGCRGGRGMGIGIALLVAPADDGGDHVGNLIGIVHVAGEVSDAPLEPAQELLALRLAEILLQVAVRGRLLAGGLGPAANVCQGEELLDLPDEAQENVHDAQANQVDVRPQQGLDHGRQGDVLVQAVVPHGSVGEGVERHDQDDVPVLHRSPAGSDAEQVDGPAPVAGHDWLPPRHALRDELEQGRRGRVDLRPRGHDEDALEALHGQDARVLFGHLVHVHGGARNGQRVGVAAGVGGLDRGDARPASHEPLRVNLLLRLYALRQRVEQRLAAAAGPQVLQDHGHQDVDLASARRRQGVGRRYAPDGAQPGVPPPHLDRPARGALARRVSRRCELRVGSDDGHVVAEVCLVGEEGGRIVVLAKGLPRGERGLDHGDVVGPEDQVEDLEDARRDEGGILGRLVDQRGEDPKGYLDIAAKSTQKNGIRPISSQPLNAPWQHEPDH